MKFNIIYSNKARQQIGLLRVDKSLEKRYKSVIKTIALMSVDLRHPSLNTHEFSSLSKRLGIKVFESYAENNTPGAYRVFWVYAERQGDIEIIAITPHP